MSALFDRLQRLFDEGHGIELPDLRNDGQFAPPVIRPAAVLIASANRDGHRVVDVVEDGCSVARIHHDGQVVVVARAA